MVDNGRPRNATVRYLERYFSEAKMAVMNLTEARIRDLELGSGIHRDAQVKGLMVICHNTTKTFSVQGDVRRNGRHVRTVRKKIDRCDRISLREARRRAKEIMSQIQSGVDPTARPNDTGITLSEVMDIYEDGRDLSPRTLEGYRYWLDKYLKPLRNRAVSDITRSDVRDLNDTIKRRSGDTSAAAAMRTLRLLINEARRIDETIGENPVCAIRIPQTRQRQVDDINLSEWWSITEELPAIRRDMHRMFMFSGLRRESLLTIQKADVDLDAGIVLVRHMKSRRPFHLPLSDFMAELLERRMAEDVRLGSEWLWPSRNSKSGRITEPKEEDCPSPHAYRHLWRTQAIAAGVPYAESALLLDQRLPGASGGYVHQQHLANHLKKYQQMVTDHLREMIGE